MQYLAIDPMALILSEKAYLIWVEIHHPNTPLTLKDVAKAYSGMSAQEKKVAGARMDALSAAISAVKEVAGKAR